MSLLLDLGNKNDCAEFISSVKQGAIFAYPTEAVYGLGCDIFNVHSINRILKLKKRDVSKGLIVISDNLEKVRELIDDNYFKLFVENNSDATPTTWLCPSSDIVPPEITGGHNKIGIRITNHEVSCELCKVLDFPIISTSANISGQDPVQILQDCINIFGKDVDYIIKGPIGKNKKPSRIIDLISKKVLREGG